MPPDPRCHDASVIPLLHDVRTPLTVLQGRLQLLARFLAAHPQPAQTRLLAELTIMQDQITAIAHRLDAAQDAADETRS